nr:HAD-IA family hydrolase [Caulobacter mirabilis]
MIADSERLACGVAAVLATELGAPTTEDEGLELFMGRRAGDVQALVEARSGRACPGFIPELQRRTLAAFSNELQEVTGATRFVRALAGRRKCIASSSAQVRLRAALDRLGLAKDFAGAVFSADEVERGKPYPDLFLYAANRMSVAPERCVVIEDSVSGVRAAVEARMAVIGLLAGSHVDEGHAARLEAAGATAIARRFEDVADWIAERER